MSSHSHFVGDLFKRQKSFEGQWFISLFWLWKVNHFTLSPRQFGNFKNRYKINQTSESSQICILSRVESALSKNQSFVSKFQVEGIETVDQSDPFAQIL